MGGILTDRTAAVYDPGAFTDYATGQGVGGSHAGPTHMVPIAGIALLLGVLFIIEHFGKKA
jgi:hypothetical protein